MTGHFSKITDIAPDVIALLEKEKKGRDFFERTLAIYPCLCASYGLSLSIRGDFKKGISFCEKGNLIATEIKDLMTLVTTELNFGILYANQGEYNRSKKHLESCAKFAKEMNFPFFEGTTSTFIGWNLYLREDLEMAMDKIKQAINIQENMGTTSFLSYSYSFLSIVRSDLGQHNRAVKDAHEALDLALKHNNKQQEGLAKIFLGKSLGRADLNKVDEAVESLLQGINILEQEKYRPRVALGYFYLGELQIEMGQKENGIESLSKAERMFKEMGMAYWISETEKIINH